MIQDASRATYHIDQDVERVTLPLLQQLSRVVLCALGLPVLFAEIALERLLTPGSFQRVGDGSERAHALVLAGILQEEGQRAMPTHAVACDAHSAGVDLLEVLEYRFGQLVRHVGVHVVVLGPGFGSRVDVETSTGAKVVALVLALNANSACDVSAHFSI